MKKPHNLSACRAPYRTAATHTAAVSRVTCRASHHIAAIRTAAPAQRTHTPAPAHAPAATCRTAHACLSRTLAALAALAAAASPAAAAERFSEQSASIAAATTQIWGNARVENIDLYALGQLWTQFARYFAPIALIAVIAVISAFALHYMVIGPKRFSHEGSKIYTFNLFERGFHFIAAFSWVILVPTGLVIMNASSFGGGSLVRLAKNLHGCATILFFIAIWPMFFCWIRRMLPASYDLRWLMIVGGYLSKEKRPVPAGKFNFGQKMWYYTAVFGGFVMILTGVAMYLLDFQSAWLQSAFGLSHINILRAAALVHNCLGIVCAVMFCVHIYMTVFAIKGAIFSMVNGYKELEEVQILHSYWYKELLANNKVNAQ